MSPYLEQIVNNVEPILQNTYHQICDTQFRFCYVGEGFANLLGMSTENIIHKKLSEIDCLIQQHSPTYRKLNFPVINNKLKAHYATIIYLGQDLCIFQNSVRPILSTTGVEGILIETTCTKNQLTNFGLDVLSVITKQHVIIYDYIQETIKANLNELEELLLFLIAIGKTDKEITNILKFIRIYVSSHALSKIITRKLYPKLEVDSRSELINKIFREGLHNNLPRLLINHPKLLAPIAKLIC